MTDTRPAPPVAKSDSATDRHRDYDERRKKALDSCNQQLKWFEGAITMSRLSLRIAQIITVVITAVIPVLLLAHPPSWLTDAVSVKLLAAILSAIVAIAAGLTGAFNWQEHWTRSAFFREQLRSERHRFETRTGDYAADDETALDRFVTRVETLRLNEVSEWRRFVRASADKDQGPEGDDNAKPE